MKVFGPGPPAGNFMAKARHCTVLHSISKKPPDASECARLIVIMYVQVPSQVPSSTWRCRARAGPSHGALSSSGTLPSFDIEAKIPDIDIWTILNTKPSISKVSDLASISGTICNFDIKGLYFYIKVGMLRYRST